MARRKPGRVPSPPSHLSGHELETWRQLARDVEAARTFVDGSLSAFQLLVSMVSLSSGPEAAGMAATARVRLLQACATLLREFGLTPMGADRVAKVPEPKARRDPDFEEW
jgi:hypothetical protein